jgi:hypothetical protein
MHTLSQKPLPGQSKRPSRYQLAKKLRDEATAQGVLKLPRFESAQAFCNKATGELRSLVGELRQVRSRRGTGKRAL